MGVLLTPIIVSKKVLNLNYFKEKTFAVDAYNVLYQFLALIRTSLGMPLTSPNGKITSHIVGLSFRVTKLMSEYNMRFIFVFDGRPSSLKIKELEKRREQRNKAYKEWIKAINEGDLERAFSKAVVMLKLTKDMVDESKKLLDLLGIPWVQAPSEGEAQAAYLVKRGDAWAVNSRDYDSLLFGAPKLVRYLTISGTEFLPSKGVVRPLKPELIELNDLLNRLKITKEQLIDIAILVGTDYNKGVKGIGSKRALRLIMKYRKIENLPLSILRILPKHWKEVRKIFLNPEITDNYKIEFKRPNKDGLVKFLCEERGFSRKRVKTILERISKISESKQEKLEKWF